MSAGTSGRSETLAKVVQTLRLHQPKHDSDFSAGSISNKDSIVGDSASESVSSRARSRSQPNRAAVLVCLFEGESGEIRVILTKRSSAMSSHSGEVALPGGRWEEGDENDAETALREAKEEIGLEPSAVEIITILEPYHTKRNIIVYPVVGVLWDKNGFNPAPNATEVESVFDVPLEMFLKNENRREQAGELMGYKFTVQLFDYQTKNTTYVIWALTAAILIKTASVVFQRPPAFEERAPVFWGRSRH
ncbi:nudix hydrolase 15, mitochondrial-like isoform X1 [Andrographis paniculata]|uniref:nudix hydrolase 15, mitochondrial-like isoform X1 n=1 Tax=Andrographis paniculata TaxID=175694 RepID=UPI0021E95AB8|nr:nudix hydrolase 15, mitochondrial-like isoform X1 [Andrographis paniculata]